MDNKNVAETKGEIMLINSSLELLVFLEQLPKETHEKIILVMEIIVIIVEIISFFVIRHICKR